jgi:hypothetical protein
VKLIDSIDCLSFNAERTAQAWVKASNTTAAREGAANCQPVCILPHARQQFDHFTLRP